MSKAEFFKIKKERIAIIGGGLSGLTIAYFLAQKEQDIFVYEKNSTLGGELSTIKLSSGSFIERFYHHIFLNNTEVISLFSKLGLKEKIKWRRSNVAVLKSGKIYKFNSVADLFSLPFIGFWDKFRMGLGSVLIPILSHQRFKEITSKQLVIRYMGKRVWERFWRPMFRLKFDNESENISGVWFWARLKDRISSRKVGELLGYPEGSFQILIDALEKKLEDHNVKIKTDFTAPEIIQQGNQFVINGEFFDKVICAMDICSFLEISPKSIEERGDLETIGHKAVIVVLLVTSEKISDYYWTNVLDEDTPFGVIVEQTNLIPSEVFGTNLVYLGRYLNVNNPLFSMSDAEIFEVFTKSFDKIYPDSKKKIKKYFVFRETYAQPVITTNYKTPEIKTSINGLYLFSSAHIYPKDRGLENVVLGAKKVVETILYN